MSAIQAVFLKEAYSGDRWQSVCMTGCYHGGIVQKLVIVECVHDRLLSLRMSTEVTNGRVCARQAVILKYMYRLRDSRMPV